MSTELRNRLLLGPLMAAFFLGVLALDIGCSCHFGIWVLILLVTPFGLRELQRLFRDAGMGFPYVPVLLSSLVLISLPLLGHGIPVPAWAARFMPLATEVCIGLGMLWVGLLIMFRHGFEGFIARNGAALFALLYSGFLTSMLLALAVQEGSDPMRGTRLLIVFVATCKLGDTCAFFGGRLFGRHKMAPRVSPGKTWEGFGFSVLGSVLGALLAERVLVLFGQAYCFDAIWKPVLWGLLIGPVGVFGDLVESCFKRDAAIKDSGSSIPGFGGFLDVFDALLYAAPLAVLLAHLL